MQNQRPTTGKSASAADTDKDAENRHFKGKANTAPVHHHQLGVFSDVC
jgi:hypothetical protein